MEKSVSINSKTSLVIFNDLKLLKNALNDLVDTKIKHEIVFGFQNSDKDLITELKSLQSNNKFLHCYGFNESVENVLQVLESLTLYDNVLFYPDNEFFPKKTKIDNNFDFSTFYSLEKINLGILTCSWKRPKLTAKYCDHIDFLKKRFENHLNIRSIIVDSDNINEKKIKKSESLYFSHQNQPLSDKFNFGMKHFENKNVDYVMILGSDNFIDETLLMEFIKIMRNKFDLIGVLNSYLYDLKTKKTYRFMGYPKKNPRHGETLGAGRILSKNILSSLGYQPWKNGLSKGLDGSMWKKLSKLNFVEYKINVNKIDGVMLGVKTSTFITDINRIVNKVEISNDFLEKIKCLNGFPN